MIYHECEVCGGSLDPGEGRICDECHEKEDEKLRMQELMHRMIHSTDYKQVELEDYLSEHYKN